MESSSLGTELMNDFESHIMDQKWRENKRHSVLQDQKRMAFTCSPG